MKKTILIGLALICTTMAGLLWLYLSMVGRSYAVASNSMLPVLGKGEVVSCATRGAGELTYGDFVIYRNPHKKAQDSKMIKMVVGLAGDGVQMQDGALWINGKAVPQRRAGDFEIPGTGGKKAPRFEETLPNSVKTFVLDTDPSSLLDNTAIFTVPASHVFVIGNNRDNSTDSRMANLHGPVPIGNIICKAEV